MIGFCPECEKETELMEFETVEEFEIRGKKIPIELTLLKCDESGHLFYDPDSDDDPLDRAYRAYRKHEGLLQPEEIKEARLSYGLTQRELSGILGWGGATLSRYENGALQSEAHDTLVRLSMKPDNLFDLIKQNEATLSKETSKRLIAQLQDRLRLEQRPFMRLMEMMLVDYEADELSGFLPFNLDKFIDAILFHCSNEVVYKTKLNKPLFFSDFKHYKEYAASITGVRYAHLPYGPAPDNFDLLLAMLQENERIALVERAQQNFVGEVVVALDEPSINQFSSSEIKILAEIKEYFQGVSSKQISEISHSETGYRETRNGDLIPYSFADSLSI
jgi:putative zinc finger/helix-turn-helix YgiT family protein